MERTSAHDARAVANKILDIRELAGGQLTIMQLIKLAYIADGWSIALLGRPLIKEDPEAWQYGPVYRSIYNAFSGFGARPVKGRANVHGTDVPIVGEFTDDEEKIVEMVVHSYGKLSAFSLSNLTHQSGTPWSEAYDKGRYTAIDIEKIREHFESLKAKRLVKRESAV